MSRCIGIMIPRIGQAGTEALREEGTKGRRDRGTKARRRNGASLPALLCAESCLRLQAGSFAGTLRMTPAFVPSSLCPFVPSCLRPYVPFLPPCLFLIPLLESSKEYQAPA